MSLIQSLARLQVFLSKGPVYLYTYGRWRVGGWWRKKLGRSFDMTDAVFFNQLDLHELVNLKDAVAEKDYQTARSGLAAYFRRRERPRFHFTWSDRARILSVVSDEQQRATILDADEVCRNIFRFRRVAPIRFEDGINWTFCPAGNTDWTWDLNRHPYFITLGKAYWYTGNEKYAAKFIELLLDWMGKNPSGVGRQNWDSVLEVAVRLNTWIWAFFFFRRAAAFGQDELVAFLKGLLVHARYLAARIERHAANNHLLLEAKALAFCGLLFPEFKEARQWCDSGLRILRAEVEKQVCSDGVHAERALLYHRRILSDLLEMLVLLENNDAPVPEPIIRRVEKMLDFDRHITKPDGTIPLFGDSALAELQARFSGRGGGTVLLGRIRLDEADLDEEMAWLLGRRDLEHAVPIARDGKLASRAFPEGGYFVMRGGAGPQGLYLAFDCGPFGYKPVPIHGHADALSFALFAYGSSLITDCGVYSYHMGDDWRDYFRGTRAHNTIVVDGRDQSALLKAGRVYRMAQATLHRWESNEHYDLVDGSHDGYSRLAEPVLHRRKIFFFKPEYWIVVDLLTGQGQHRLEQPFHLMPWAMPEVDQATKAARVKCDGRQVLTIVPLDASLEAEIITGATDPIQGWVSFFSGEKIAAPVLQYGKNASMPVSLVTVLYPHPPGGNDELRAMSIAVTAVNGEPLDENRVSGLAVETAEHLDLCVVSHDGAPAWKTFAGYESDGEIVHVRCRKRDGTITKIIVKAGTKLSFQGRTLWDTRGSLRDLTLDCEIVMERDE